MAAAVVAVVAVVVVVAAKCPPSIPIHGLGECAPMSTVPKSIHSNLPVLGVGMGYRNFYRNHTLPSAEHIDFLEITADHFLGDSREQSQQLDRLQETFTLIPHGLNLSLGSAEGLNRPYLRQLRNLVGRVAPPWWSEHISFTQAAGVEIGHLSPTPFNKAALEKLTENISIAQEEIEVPLILENITYPLRLPWNTIPEEEFLLQLLEKTGCGLLLDVTNLYINSTTHNYDPIALLKNLPSDKVVQLHFVGYQLIEGELVDNHSQPTNDGIWNLLETVLEMFPVKGAILERDGNFPAMNDIIDELARLRKIGRAKSRWN